MEKYTMILTDEQIERIKARKKAIDGLEYNPICYNCMNFEKSCSGTKNKVYSGCIYREVCEDKPSIYAQIINQIY